MGCEEENGFVSTVKWIADNKQNIDAIVALKAEIKTVADNIDYIASIIADSEDLPPNLYYVDSGATNSVVLDREDGNALAQQYAGMMVLFSPKEANTGATTIRVDELEILPLKLYGEELVAGTLVPDMTYLAFYVVDHFELRSIVKEEEVDNLVSGKLDKVETITDMLLLDKTKITSVIVTDPTLGGSFFYDATRSEENDGKDVFYGWVRIVFNELTRRSKLERLLIASAEADNNNVTYIVTGDSTRSNDFNFMIEYYESQFAKIGVTVVRNASSGQSAYEWWQNVDQLTLQDAIDATTGTGEDTILEYSFGINDYGNGTEALIKSLIKDGLDSYLTAKPDATVIMVSPVITSDTDRNDMLQRIYEEVSQELNLELINGQIPTIDIHGDPEFYEDSTHPNASGSKRIVNYILSIELPAELISLVTLDEITALADQNRGNTAPAVEVGYWGTTSGSANSTDTWRRLASIPVVEGDKIFYDHGGNRIECMYVEADETFIEKQTSIPTTAPANAAFARINITDDAATWEALNYNIVVAKGLPKTISDGYYSKTSGTISLNTDWRKLDKIVVEPEMIMTIDHGGNRNDVVFYDENDEYLGYTIYDLSGDKKITTPKACKFIGVNVTSDGANYDGLNYNIDIRYVAINEPRTDMESINNGLSIINPYSSTQIIDKYGRSGLKGQVLVSDGVGNFEWTTL